MEGLSEIASAMAAPATGVELKTRRYLLKWYPNCFIGSQCVSWIMENQKISREEAIELGNQLLNYGFIRHCVDPLKPLIDGFYFYKFTERVEYKNTTKTSCGTNDPYKLFQFMSHPETGVKVRNRKYHMKTYHSCFVASKAVDWLMYNAGCRTRKEAENVGNMLVDLRLIEHVCDPQPFADHYLFFRFTDNSTHPPQVTATKTYGVDDFEQLHVLGQGGFGTVFLVRKKDDQSLFAMKIIDKANIQSEKEALQMINERNVLINTCPFLLHLYYSFQSDSKLYLVTDYLPGGDMLRHLTYRQTGFSVSAIRFFAAELVLAIEHLHHCGIVYRDMKLENILFDATGHICLVDFGLAKLTGSEGRTKTFCGSPGYTAPEILRGEEYGFAVDWFALGVVLYELATKSNPFASNNYQVTYVNILHKSLEFPPGFNAKLQHLIQSLTKRNPEDRLTNVHFIKSHSFFKGIEWTRLAIKKIKSPMKQKKREINPGSSDCFIDLEDDSEWNLSEVSSSHDDLEDFEYSHQ